MKSFARFVHIYFVIFVCAFEIASWAGDYSQSNLQKIDTNKRIASEQNGVTSKRPKLATPEQSQLDREFKPEEFLPSTFPTSNVNSTSPSNFGTSVPMNPGNYFQPFYNALPQLNYGAMNQINEAAYSLASPSNLVPLTNYSQGPNPSLQRTNYATINSSVNNTIPQFGSNQTPPMQQMSYVLPVQNMPAINQSPVQANWVPTMPSTVNSRRDNNTFLSQQASTTGLPTLNSVQTSTTATPFVPQILPEQPRSGNSDAQKNKVASSITTESIKAETRPLDEKKQVTLVKEMQPKDMLGTVSQEKIHEVYRALLMDGKPGIILQGPPHIGKRTLLLQVIAELRNGSAPKKLSQLRFFELDTPLLLSYVGQILDMTRAAVKQAREGILFIPDAEDLLAKPGVNDLLGFILSRGYRVILSTTQNPFVVRHHRAPESRSLEKYFETIMVENLSEDALYAVLKSKYAETQNGAIKVCDEALRDVSSLVPRYFKNSVHLEKALKILNDVIANNLIDRSSDDNVCISREAIKKQIAIHAKIPSSLFDKEVDADDSDIAKKLQKRVVGQDFAIGQVCDCVACLKLGLNDPRKPAGVFFFVGPTGVGKTELAKAIAEEVFGREDSLIRIDMGEYAEAYNISRLIGSSPGLVGHEQGGQLTNALAKNPCAVVLFDEIEKAHKDIFKIFLSLFDEGIISSTKSEKINAKDAIFVMTSNLGAQELCEMRDSELCEEAIQEVITRILKGHFPPEFVNRIKTIVPFFPIKRENFNDVVVMHMNRFAKDVFEMKQWEIDYDNDVIEYLADTYYDKVMGVRPLCNKGIESIRRLIAKAVLAHKKPLHAGSRIAITINDGHPVVTIQQ